MRPLPLVGFRERQRLGACSVPIMLMTPTNAVLMQSGEKDGRSFVGLASIQCCRHTPLAGIRAWGMVMRINTMIVFQAIIATLSGIAVMYLQRRIAGPLGGIIPGVLGFLIGWLVTAAIPDDIESLRRWLRRRASRELQPK
jgi:hypothetical protein